jgi:N-acyl-D-aspartate/D-glutamate deacylase
MTEGNVIRAMRQEFISFDTDMGPAGVTPPPGSHPRGYGAFPRVLGRYVRDLGVLSLEGAVQRMTAVAANELMLADRGRLAPGSAADIVVFDAEHVRDRSTFAEPHRTALGIRFVLVGGRLVLEDGKPNGARPGRVLRGPGFRPRGSAP